MKASDWISVDERLPENGDIVLCCHDEGVLVCQLMQKSKSVTSWDDNYGNDVFNVTHWMPIVPPETKE